MALPVAVGRLQSRQARRLDDDLSSVVHSGLGVVTKCEPVALNLFNNGGVKGEVYEQEDIHFHFMSRI